MKHRVILGLATVVVIAAGCAMYFYINKTPDLRFDVNIPMAPFAGGSEALDYVLTRADTMSSVQLFVGASTAYHLKRWQDAAFLFYAARVRARYELAKYKPVDEGGDSPAIFLGFLDANCEEMILEKIAKSPKDRAEVRHRLDQWTIREPWGFDPGWKYNIQKMPADAIERAVAAVRQYQPGKRIYYADNFFDDHTVAELAEAAKYGNIERIDALLADGVDVNTPGKEGMSVLMYSMAGDKLDGFRRLLERGANPNLQTEEWNSAMSYAAAREEPEALMLLIAHGGNPNLKKRCKNTFCPTPIFDAVRFRRVENVKILVKAGANLTERPVRFGNPPLFTAACCNAYDIMLILLEAGADFRVKDSLGYSIATYLDSSNNLCPDAAEAKRKCIEYMEKKGFNLKREKEADDKLRRQRGTESETIKDLMSPPNNKS